jgi:hypothetical protein
MFIPDPDLEFLPIPDPGVTIRYAPDPGSGSATLIRSRNDNCKVGNPKISASTATGSTKIRLISTESTVPA